MANSASPTSRYDYDLICIGAGSGGVRASRFAASYGARVAVIEDGPLGGTCVNVGCVPKKLFYYASRLHHDAGLLPDFGWEASQPAFDWSRLIQNKNQEIARLNGIYRRILAGAGVEIILGRGHIEGPNTVSVGETTLSARYILVAVGGRPWMPDFPGSEQAIVSDAAFYLEEMPERALVVGGGYIGVEFAGIWNGLGAQVTQVYRGEMFLRGFDGDVRSALALEMQNKGIDLRFHTEVTAIVRQADGSLRATLSSKDRDDEELDVDLVLYATGRVPRTDDLGLENTAVRVGARGFIEVDDQLCTAEPSIYAIGDCIERPFDLTPVALHEGMAVAATLFDDRPTSPEYDSIATAVFSQPPIGTVGLTEEEARERFGADNIEIYRSRYRALKLTLGDDPERSLMKLVVDRGSRRVLGVHVLDSDAAEIVQGFAVAVKMGATKEQLDATIGIHPTSAEELVTLRDPVS